MKNKKPFDDEGLPHGEWVNEYGDTLNINNYIHGKKEGWSQFFLNKELIEKTFYQNGSLLYRNYIQEKIKVIMLRV